MKKIILTLLVLTVMIFLASCQRIPTESLGGSILTQYAGSLVKCGNFLEFSGVQNNEAIIGDYRIVTEQSSNEVVKEFLGCKDTTNCDGDITTDENGCQIFTKQVSKTETVCKGRPTVQCGYDTSICGSKTFRGQSVECCGNTGCPQEDVKITYKETKICGGSNTNTIKEGLDCYSKHKVYYKGNLVFESDDWIWNDDNIYLRKGQQVPSGEEDINLILHRTDQLFRDTERINCPDSDNSIRINKGCKSIINEILPKFKENDLIFEIETPEQNVRLDDKLKYNIIVTNDWISDLSAELEVDLTVKYILFGQEKELTDTLTEQINIPTGDNIFNFEVPIEVPSEEITIIPRLTILMSGTKLSGANKECHNQIDNIDRDVSQCEFISLGDIQLETITLDTSVDFECQIESDCEKECEEQTSSCVNGKCEISGECEETIIKKIPTIAWIIGGIILLLIIVIAIFMARKRKN